MDPLLTVPRHARRHRPRRGRWLASSLVLALVLGLSALSLALGLTGLELPL